MQREPGIQAALHELSGRGANVNVRRMSPAGGVGKGSRARGNVARLLLLLSFAHGCAPVTVPPSPPRALPGKPAAHVPTPSQKPVTAPAARPRPLPGYTTRIDGLGSVDTTALRGHRIALDPGHGGMFRGAMGTNGLTEAEANLGVALHLRGLLEARGAVVFMTRTDDRDFATPADSSLRADLAERTRIANAFRPELFVSIHHNADARGTHDVNETQTYYKLGDEGPSLDAAQSVHRFLVRNLGIRQHRILPGNYFVLRNSAAPGILTESSYITNPDVESKLALAAKQRLEAEALYLGLAHYFARSRPVVDEFAARSARDAAPDSVFRERSPALLSAAISGPYDASEMQLDGASLAVVRHGPLLTASLPALESGPHVALLRVRLGGSGAAPEQRLEFRVVSAPQAVRFSERGSRVDSSGGVSAARLEVLDARGLPVRDSVWVRLRSGDAGVTPHDTLVCATDGVAWGYFQVAANTKQAAITARLETQASGAERRWSPVSRTPQHRDCAIGFALLGPDGVPLANALGTREPQALGAWINRDGFVVCPRDSVTGFVSIPRLPGYRMWPSEVRWPPRFTAIAGGALHGKRIVLDPDGGGDQDGGTGVSGTRAANLNLDVARALAGMLQAAGAEVMLTRSGDLALSDVERVQLSEAFHADRFVRIGHRAEAPMAGYYFSSAPGRRWAERTVKMLVALGLGTVPVAEDAQYPLQQTSCPALYVSAARIDDAAAEDRLVAPGALRAEAYAIYWGLIGEWSETAEHFDTATVRDAAGQPLAGAIVTLGLSTLLETGPEGTVRFARSEPGPIVLEAVRGKLHARHVLLESESGVTLIGAESH